MSWFPRPAALTAMFGASSLSAVLRRAGGLFALFRPLLGFRQRGLPAGSRRPARPAVCAQEILQRLPTKALAERFKAAGLLILVDAPDASDPGPLTADFAQASGSLFFVQELRRGQVSMTVPGGKRETFDTVEHLSAAIFGQTTACLAGMPGCTSRAPCSVCAECEVYTEGGRFTPLATALRELHEEGHGRLSGDAVQQLFRHIVFDPVPSPFFYFEQAKYVLFCARINATGAEALRASLAQIPSLSSGGPAGQAPEHLDPIVRVPTNALHDPSILQQIPTFSRHFFNAQGVRKFLGVAPCPPRPPRSPRQATPPPQ
ncbi:hypothetical protein H696_02175 [Fonticula alba]|uniref:Nudix hydrolase domain-containing protein n=1 Tax=Fonticula alba TaxID=691883 RepID=A0A058ZA90_FONAL|nr:hypothetical protein H696_02175 [Fonticula alba]KCV71224.1 hypothetical protein H696_02175 [Fonticula alba]|eukprot:XP_009494347.1 hypothetical protein H696_02175 [Fonticula alba]